MARQGGKSRQKLLPHLEDELIVHREHQPGIIIIAATTVVDECPPLMLLWLRRLQ